jgi:hypothetical protein
MKNKNIKKLSLNKRLITNLSKKEKFDLKGGTTGFFETNLCYTEHKSCSLLINCCPPAEKLDNETKYYC